MNNFLNRIPEPVIWAIGCICIIAAIGLLYYMLSTHTYVFSPEFISLELK